MSGILNAFANLFVQIAFTAGIVGLCGMFISFCNRIFCDCFGKTGFFVLRVSGIIGTPVHELSHAFMCLLFGHRITKIKIYGYNKRSKNLGFVEHTYDPKNLYHRIGNFFIGIAPIVVGGLAVTLFVRVLTPKMYSSMMSGFRAVVGASDKEFFKQCFFSLADMLVSFFNFNNFSNVWWWLCILLCFSISVHMEISRSDIKGGLGGLAVISLMLLVVDLVVCLLFPRTMTYITSAIMNAGIFISTFLMIPAVFSGILLLLCGVVSLARALGKSIENSQK